MRGPTDEEFERLKNEPEDKFMFLESDEVENLDDIVDTDPALLVAEIECDKHQQIVADYHYLFIELAAEKGLTFQKEAHPNFDNVKIPEEITFQITVNPRHPDSIIAKRLEVFKKHVLGEVEKKRTVSGGWEPQFMMRDIKDKRESPIDIYELKRKLDFAIKVYRLGKPFLATASVLGLIKDSHNSKECNAAEKKVERSYNWAEKLIGATIKGTFFDELRKPLRE